MTDDPPTTDAPPTLHATTTVSVQPPPIATPMENTQFTHSPTIQPTLDLTAGMEVWTEGFDDTFQLTPCSPSIQATPVVTPPQ